MPFSKIYSQMKRYSKTKILLALFFILYVPAFWGLFEFYCLSDADIFGSASFEEPDLLSESACSSGNAKFVIFDSDHDSVSILYNWFFQRPRSMLLQIPSLDAGSEILRC